MFKSFKKRLLTKSESDDILSKLSETTEAYKPYSNRLWKEKLVFEIEQNNINTFK
ncbi:hypothetical protein [Clostridium beijerinckii]|uniref:hypothetical protein n=1 Tax=Clostridium beijerinckii TaxID=1520 RepID=UPI00156FA9D6|nr:hypothetical protein [Clostridium beijerinckii]